MSEPRIGEGAAINTVVDLPVVAQETTEAAAPATTP